MTRTHPAALALAFLTWVAIFACLALYGVARVVVAALRLVVR